MVLAGNEKDRMGQGVESKFIDRNNYLVNDYNKTFIVPRRKWHFILNFRI